MNLHEPTGNRVSGRSGPAGADLDWREGELATHADLRNPMEKRGAWVSITPRTYKSS